MSALYDDSWQVLLQALGRLVTTPEGMIALLTFVVVLSAARQLKVQNKKLDRWPRRKGAAALRLRSPSTPLVAMPTIDMTDPNKQFEYISRVEFEPLPLLNKSEYRVLLHLEAAVKEVQSGFRVMAQTNMGEIIRPKRNSAASRDLDGAFASINSKRLDFVVINQRGFPVLAVEYHGRGHFHAKTFMRDAVKREVLRKSNIQFLEISADFERDELLDTFRQRLRGLTDDGRVQ